MYNLHHIRYFVTAAAAQSLAVAAQKHRVSQSAVSQAIVALEASFGLQLITHERKLFRLTDAGTAMVPQCMALLASAEEVLAAAEGLKTGFGGQLKLACTNSLASGFLTTPLRLFKALAPQVQVIVKVGNSEVIKAWLLNGDVDLGLAVRDHGLEHGVDAVPVLTGRYQLVKPRRYRGQVFHDGLIVTRRDRPEVQQICRLLAAADSKGREPRVDMEIISWEAIKAYLLGGAGFGILPDYLLRGAASGLQVVDLDGEAPGYAIVAVTKGGRSLGRNGSLLLEQLRLYIAHAGTR